MKYRDFVSNFKEVPIITPDLIRLDPKPNYLRRLISGWQQKGWLLNLKRGYYVINQDSFKDRLNNFYIANQIYQPSYISMESALSTYGMIPEAVFAVTSISTRKTMTFKNTFATFRYYTLRPSLYWGFKCERVSGLPVMIADKEKALLDFLYLNMREFKTFNQAVESYRLSGIELLNKTKVREYLRRFNNPNFSRVLEGML